MLKVAELVYLFTGDTKQLDAAYARADAGAEKSAGVAREAGRQIGGALAGLGLAYTGAEAIKMAVNFQTAMTKIQTQAGASSSDVKILSKQILGLGGKVQQSPEQLADAMFHLKSVGMDNAAAMKALKASSDLAAVGGANLEDTVNALAGAWRSGIKGASDFGTTAATVNAIIGAGNMKMSDLTAAMSSGILPAAKTFGVSFKQVGAALALMTDEGVPAQLAATRLRMTLSLMGAPSTTAAKALASIGLTSDQLGNKMRSPGGFISAVQLLKTKLEASGLSATDQAAVISRAFGGGESSAAIMTMLNNVTVLKGKFDQINGSVGKFGGAVAAQRQTAQAQFALLKSAAESLGIKVGTSLLPPITKFVTYLTSTVVPEMKKFGHVAGDVLGPIAGWLGKEGLLGPLVTLAATLLALKKLGVIKLGMKLTGRGATAVEGGGMQTAADTMVTAAANMQRAADTMVGAETETGASGGAGAAKSAAGGVLGTSITMGELVPVVALAATAAFGLSKVKTPGGGSLLSPKKSDLGVGGNFWKLLFGGSKPPAAKTPSPSLTGQKPLPAAKQQSSGILGGDWNAAYQSFFNGFASPVAHWFTVSLPNAVGDIGRFFSGRWDSAYQSFFNGFASPISSFFTNAIPNALSSAVSGISYYLGHSNFGQLITSGLGGGLASGGQQIQHWLYKDIYQPVVGYFAGAGRWLWSEGSALVDGIGGGIGAAAKGVGGWLYRDVYQPVQGYFSGAGSWLWQHGKNLVGGLGGGIATEAKSIGGWLYADIWKPVTGYFSGAGSWLYGHGKSLIVGLGSGIGAEARSVGGWLYSDIYRPVTGYFSGAGSWLWNHGRNVISGLYNGMTAGLGNAKKWVGQHIFNPIKNAIIDLFKIQSPSKVMHGLGTHVMTGFIGGLLKGKSGLHGIINSIFGGATKAIGDLVSGGLVDLSSLPAKALSALGSLPGGLSGLLGKIFGGGSGGGSGVSQWKGVVLEALALNHLPASLASQVMYQIGTESGGNPKAINLTDSNAAAGDPSRGLLQTIGSTFAAYHVAGTSNNIFDPLANVAAAINYAKHVYGPGLMNHYGGLGSGHGYKDGSWSIPATGPAVVHQGEMILPIALASAVRGALSKGGDGASQVSVQVLLDGQAIEPRMHKVIVKHDKATARAAGAGTGRR